MKLAALALSAALLAAASAPVAASANIEATKACFADNTSGKDRKALGKWVFLAMSAHPEITGFSRASDADMDRSSQELAEVFMRLVTRDCVQQLRRMMAVDGSGWVRVAVE
jgi:hypothetical protein